MDEWPIYFKDRLIVSNLSSSVAIATLWTPKELVQKMVDPDAFAVMGQLYTKKGINYLLRNILANPKISKLYLIGNDLMGSGEAIKRLMDEGINEDYRIIGDDIAKLEHEIPREAIEAFRKNVELVDLSGTANLAKAKSVLSTLKAEDGTLWREAETFPEPPKAEVASFPSEVDLIKIRRTTVADTYLAILKHISMFGLESEAVINYVSDTSKSMKELLNLTAVVTEEDPNNWYLPDYLPFSKTDLEKYFKGFFDFDPATEDYTYGERLFNYAHKEIKALKEIYPWLKMERFQQFFTHGGYDQVQVAIIRKLQGFKYDKGAIALLSNPFTDMFPQRPPKKTPCLVLIQCQIYQGKLNMTAYFRSNDMYSAWPLNAFALRKLQGDISGKLDVETGSLITISNMAHIYEHNFTDAEDLVKKHYKGNCEWDPRGNFQIELDTNEIVVRLMTPRGNEELKEWRLDGKLPNAARQLCFQIESDLAISILGNALYMGRQIERAEIAVKLGINFAQDNPLDLSSISPDKLIKAGK